MGNVFRRLVSRTCAQRAAGQFARRFHTRCRPRLDRQPWHASSTPPRRREAAPLRSVSFSVDGVGACDHIARAAIFEGLRRDARLAVLIPFVLFFSSFLFMARKAHTPTMMLTGVPTPSSKPKEANKETHSLMPGLYAVGVHGALLAANASSRPKRGALHLVR